MTSSTTPRPKARPPGGEDAGDGRWSRRRVLLATAITLPLTTTLSTVPRADEGGRAREAAAFIRRMVDRALEILAQTDKPEQERIAELERLLEEATDLDLIAKLVLGSYWRKATPEQRRRYLDLFRKMIRRQIAANISRYDGQRIEIVGSRDIDDRDTMVRTLIYDSKRDAPYRVDWRVRHTDGRFLIIDVVGEGVSLLITKRKEFREIVSAKGIDGLLRAMARKVEGEGAEPRAKG